VKHFCSTSADLKASFDRTVRVRTWHPGCRIWPAASMLADQLGLISAFATCS
jgi:hypothetical protein